jgi:5-methylcytosine-specific restriction enzyme A
MQRKSRLYDTARWRKSRIAFLSLPENALCVYCKRAGRRVAAEAVDHIKPHRDDPRLFWNTANWQALCGRCHNAKAAQEQGAVPQGRVVSKGCGLDGMPLDPDHRWNR